MPPAVRILSLTEKVAIPGGALVNAVELGVGAVTKVSIAQRAPSRAFTLGARGAGWLVAHDTGSKVGVEGVVGGRAGRGGRQARAGPPPRPPPLSQLPNQDSAFTFSGPAAGGTLDVVQAVPGGRWFLVPSPRLRFTRRFAAGDGSGGADVVSAEIDNLTRRRTWRGGRWRQGARRRRLVRLLPPLSPLLQAPSRRRTTPPTASRQALCSTQSPASPCTRGKRSGKGGTG